MAKHSGGHWILAVTAIAWCGCSTPAREDPFVGRSAPRTATEYADASGTGFPPNIAPADPPSPQSISTTPQGPSAGEAESLAAVVAQFGDLDEQSKQRLISDLRQTDPQWWPRLLDSFRTAIAYRRQSGNSPERRHDLVTRPGESPSGYRSDLAEQPYRPSPVDSSDAGDWRGRPLQEIAGADRGFDTDRYATRQPLGAPVDMASNRAVTLASFERDTSDWQQQLSGAIRRLESATARSPGSAVEVANHVYLRLLYLAVGRRDDAMRKIPDIPPEQQEFWAAELYAIGTWLDAGRLPSDELRATEALVHFNNARAQLAAIGALEVRNLNFCSKTSSYGIYDRFENNEFRPGQQVLLYAEIENFKSLHEMQKGYLTELASRYQIFDSRGQRASEHDFRLMNEHCQNPRRDYFVSYRLEIPDWLYDGQYTLQLTVEDRLAKKIGQSSIRFTVKR